MLHIHVFLAAPLRPRHMAKPRAGQHQGGVAVRERSHHAGSAADLTVQPLDHVVGADTGPMLTGKITVGQRFLDAVFDLPGGLLQLHGAQLGDHGFRLLTGRLFALLSVDRLEHGQVFWSSHALMPSEKCWIATAGQHSAPNSSLVKTARPFWTAHTGIALDLVATQIFARRFAAI